MPTRKPPIIHVIPANAGIFSFMNTGFLNQFRIKQPHLSSFYFSPDNIC